MLHRRRGDLATIARKTFFKNLELRLIGEAPPPRIDDRQPARRGPKTVPVPVHKDKRPIRITPSRRTPPDAYVQNAVSLKAHCTCTRSYLGTVRRCADETKLASVRSPGDRVVAGQVRQGAWSHERTAGYTVQFGRLSFAELDEPRDLFGMLLRAESKPDAA